MADLRGKVALVTGGSKGIGSALAVGLARSGASVCLTYNTDSVGAASVREQIEAEGGRALIVQADQRLVADCRRQVEAAVAEFGRLDIACCHAGITSWGRFLDYEEAAFDAVVDTNLKGTYFTAQAAARQMIKQGGGGRIIVTSSVTGNQAIHFVSAYGMTKGGLQMLVRNLVLELSPHGITINAVAPGATTNERNLQDDPQYDQNWAKVTPMGRVANPEDMLGSVLFFASEGASHVTGQLVIVDGGWTCYSPTPEFNFVK